MRLFIYFLLWGTLIACESNPFVNSRTSQIADIESTCLSTKDLLRDYSIDSIKDPELLRKIKEFKDEPVPPEHILYFKEEPEELIGIRFYDIRGCFNRKKSDVIMNGLDDDKLSDLERVRIFIRVQTTFMKYQCDEGKLKSLEAIQNIGKNVNWGNPETREEFSKIKLIGRGIGDLGKK